MEQQTISIAKVCNIARSQVSRVKMSMISEWTTAKFLCSVPAVTYVDCLLCSGILSNLLQLFLTCYSVSMGKIMQCKRKTQAVVVITPALQNCREVEYCYYTCAPVKWSFFRWTSIGHLSHWFFYSTSCFFVRLLQVTVALCHGTVVLSVCLL